MYFSFGALHSSFRSHPPRTHVYYVLKPRSSQLRHYWKCDYSYRRRIRTARKWLGPRTTNTYEPVHADCDHWRVPTFCWLTFHVLNRFKWNLKCDFRSEPDPRSRPLDHHGYGSFAGVNVCSWVRSFVRYAPCCFVLHRGH